MLIQITITGRHLDVSDSMRNYVTEKMDHLKRLEDYIKNVSVILAIENLDKKAEAKISVKGDELYADAVGETIYAAIDVLVDKLERQLVKHKEKMTK